MDVVLCTSPSYTQDLGWMLINEKVYDKQYVDDHVFMQASRYVSHWPSEEFHQALMYKARPIMIY